MKLLTKYNRVNVVASIFVLLISSLCYYFIIRHVLLNQLDKALEVEEQEVTDYVKTNNNLPNPSIYKDQQVSYELSGNSPAKRRIESINEYSSAEQESITSRRLIFPVKSAGKNYNVSITKSQAETEDMLQLIVLITLGIVVLLLLTLFIVNRFLLNRLWQPFNNTLAELKQFNLSSKTNIQLQLTNINEFTELNNAVTMMTSKVKEDYEALKNFTENASHEMQTPLAIINSKLDVLIQDETISEYQMQQLQGVYDALDRLSRLNQSLLLLTKIENNQFDITEIIPVDVLVLEKLAQFEELISGKKLHIETTLQPARIRCNRQLADVLVNNLFNNAIRYNQAGGLIVIELTSERLVISNTSDLKALDDKMLFQKFYRHTDTKQEGNGLGLSITKQICDAYGFSAGYHFDNDLHSFYIYFK
ncbi:MAG: HAMP domain-containing sensor histidine kinase [Ferruginibacter sp.]